MRWFLIVALVMLAGCSDRELEVIAQSDPAAPVGSYCGVWKGIPGPGTTPLDGWTNIVGGGIAAPLGSASVDFWPMGSNPWGYAWNGYLTMNGGPALQCSVGQVAIGAWSQTGNTVNLTGWSGSRFDAIGVVYTPCGSATESALYCAPALPPTQTIMEVILHDRLAPVGCADRYHLIVRHDSGGLCG